MLVTPKSELERRHSEIRKRLTDNGLRYLVLGSSGQTNHRGMLRYFADYYISVFEEFLVIDAESPTVFFAHDGVGAAYVKEEGSVDEVLFIPGMEYNTVPGKCVGEYLRKHDVKKAAYAGFGGISAHFLQSMKDACPGLELVYFDHEVWEMRMRKSPYEVELSKATIKLNEDNYKYWLSLVKPGVYEDDAIDLAGAYGWSLHTEDQYWLTDTRFHPIWSPVPLAREKHHMWQEGDQIGIVLEHSAPGGHYSEVARHVFIGEPDREFKEGYELLKEAQAAGFEAMKPGNTVGDVAQAVENVMTKSAYGAYLKDGVNNMGHGQGLDIWEYPMINREDKTVLAPGMRLNLHPNVKFQDGKTANCCELYLVTENGAEKLSTLPTELTIVE